MPGHKGKDKMMKQAQIVNKKTKHPKRKQTFPIYLIFD